MKLSVYHLLFAVIIHGSIKAQSRGGVMHIGDKMPDVILGGLINCGDSIMPLTNFKSRLTIIDFFGTTCTSCIAAMPDLVKLQGNYRGSIKIILVTKDSREDVQGLMERSSILRNIKLPIVTGDSILSKYFPYRTVPEHIWLDSNLVVQFITEGYATTGKSVGDYLRGKRLDLPVKEEALDFDRSQPLFSEGNGRQLKHIKYYSLIADRISDWDGAISNDRTLYNVNVPIEKLYQCAFKKGNLWVDNPTRIILKVKKPADYKWPTDRLYSYSILVPDYLHPRIHEMMKRDLDMYFNVTSSVEIMKVKCLILRLVNNTDILKSKGGKSVFTCDVNGDNIKIKNMTLTSSLVVALTADHTNILLPIVDETDRTTRVDMDIRTGFKDLDLFEHELNDSGIQLVVGYRYLKMLVIRENS